MIKILLIFFISILFTLPAKAEVLNAGVVENLTIDQAKNLAFKDVIYHRDFSSIEKVDPLFQININAINSGQTKFKDYFIVVFTGKQYRICPYGASYGYEYNMSGKLIGIVYRNSNSYPAVYSHYTPDGNLVSVDYCPKEEIAYCYLTDGRYRETCFYGKCYDEYNKFRCNKVIKK